MKKIATLWLALACACCSLYAQNSTSPDILFIVDASGSMWQKMDGEFKVAIAKNVMQKLVDGLPEKTRAGLIAYGHNRKSDCKDIETLVPLALLDKKAFSGKLQALNPQGMTPIAKSIEHALDAIRNEMNPVTCVLVSDGLETCEGNACELVRLAKQKGMKITMHVIGFGIAEKDLSALECIAQAGGGQYLPADNADALGKALEKTIEPPLEGGGFMSVKVTLDGKPLDGLLKIFKSGDKKEIAFGRTYEGAETNPRVLRLPAGTYDLQVSAVRLDGNPTQTFTKLVVRAGDTLRQNVDFSQGLLDILVTRNGELSDAVVVLYKAGTKEVATQTRSYRQATHNPVHFKVLPGLYDVEIKSVEIASSPVRRIEGQQVGGGTPLSLKHDFSSGELKVGARKGGELVDATVSIYSKTTGKSVAAGRTYQSDTSNPKSFTLEPGHYKVDLKPVKPKDLAPKSFEVEVKVGENSMQMTEW